MMKSTRCLHCSPWLGVACSEGLVLARCTHTYTTNLAISASRPQEETKNLRFADPALPEISSLACSEAGRWVGCRSPVGAAGSALIEQWGSILPRAGFGQNKSLVWFLQVMSLAFRKALFFLGVLSQTVKQIQLFKAVISKPSPAGGKREAACHQTAKLPRRQQHLRVPQSRSLVPSIAPKAAPALFLSPCPQPQGESRKGASTLSPTQC